MAEGTGNPGPTGNYAYDYRYRSSVTGVVSDISDLSAEIVVDNTEVDLSVLLASAGLDKLILLDRHFRVQ